MKLIKKIWKAIKIGIVLAFVQTFLMSGIDEQEGER